MAPPFLLLYKLKKGAAKVLLKPAPKGSGVIAGGAVRSVVEAAGIRDLSAKILGSDNQASNVYATFIALKKMQQLVDLKGIKLKSVVEVEAEEAKRLEEEAKKAKAEQESKVAGKQTKQTKDTKKATAKKIIAKKVATSKKTATDKKQKSPVKKTTTKA